MFFINQVQMAKQVKICIKKGSRILKTEQQCAQVKCSLIMSGSPSSNCHWMDRVHSSGTDAGWRNVGLVGSKSNNSLHSTGGKWKLVVCLLVYLFVFKYLPMTNFSDEPLNLEQITPFITNCLYQSHDRENNFFKKEHEVFVSLA